MRPRHCIVKNTHAHAHGSAPPIHGVRNLPLFPLVQTEEWCRRGISGADGGGFDASQTLWQRDVGHLSVTP